MNHEGKLASILPVEDRNQPLEGVPLHRAFGRDPVCAAWTASTLRAMRDIEDHGVRRRTEAADRRPRGGLALRCTDACDDGNEQTQKNCAKRVCPHDREPLFEVPWKTAWNFPWNFPWQKSPLFSVVNRFRPRRS